MHPNTWDCPNSCPKYIPTGGIVTTFVHKCIPTLGIVPTLVPSTPQQLGSSQLSFISISHHLGLSQFSSQVRQVRPNSWDRSCFFLNLMIIFPFCNVQQSRCLSFSLNRRVYTPKKFSPAAGIPINLSLNPRPPSQLPLDTLDTLQNKQYRAQFNTTSCACS